MKTVQVSAIVQKEKTSSVALCPELDVASQGDSIDEARDALKEAVELFLESVSTEEIAERLATETHVSEFEVRWGTQSPTLGGLQAE